jgi:glycosyltransferase involved in cell wall biosynthesis
MEGFGLPGLEAMSYGAAVASSDRTSLPEVYGDAAVYFDPEDVGAIAKAVEIIIDDPEFRDSLAAKGLQRAALYSWERTAAQTLAAYRDVLDAQGSSFG